MIDQAIIQRILGIVLLIACLAGAVYYVVHAAHTPVHATRPVHTLDAPRLAVAPVETPPPPATTHPTQTFIINHQAPVEHLTTATPTSKPTHTEQWLLQVGVFADPANATSLQHKLIASPWQTTVRSMQLNHQKHVGLYVGPFSTLSDAQAAQSNLAKQQHIKAILLKDTTT